ncbi:MAG: PAS domain S-box protein [bacterium]|nr:PAS domain S-box protein [bacterium]
MEINEPVSKITEAFEKISNIKASSSESQKIENKTLVPASELLFSRGGSSEETRGLNLLTEKFKLMAENAQEGIYQLDKEGIVEYVNDAFCNNLGYSKEEFTGSTLRDLFFAEDYEKIKMFIKKAQPGLKHKGEYILKHRTGQSIYIYYSIEPLIINAEVKGFSGIMCDITERKRSEDILRESENKFRSFMETASDLMLITDCDGYITYVNAAVKKVLGYSEKELLDMHVSILLKGNNIYMSNKSDLLGQGCQLYKDIFLTKDGLEVPGETSVVAFFDKKGVFNGCRSVFHDLSQEKKLERQLRQAQKLESLGRISGGIAHDFNNLLNAIVGNATLLQLKLSDNKNIKYIDDILQISDRASKIVTQLLSFSKQTPVYFTDVNLHNLFYDVIKIIKCTGADKNIEIDMKLEAGKDSVSGDPAQLQMVLLNVVINACDAMEQGGVLSLRTSNITLVGDCAQKYSFRDGEYLEILIADTGKGILPDHLDKIFDPFFTTKEFGNGMGLASVYGTIKKHSGHIMVDSEVNKGTAFKIIVPLSKEG